MTGGADDNVASLTRFCGIVSALYDMDEWLLTRDQDTKELESHHHAGTCTSFDTVRPAQGKTRQPLHSLTLHDDSFPYLTTVDIAVKDCIDEMAPDRAHGTDIQSASSSFPSQIIQLSRC